MRLAYSAPLMVRRLRPHEFDQVRAACLRACRPVACPRRTRAVVCAESRTASGLRSLPRNRRPAFKAATPTLPDPMNGSATDVARLRALADQDLGHPDRLFSRVAAMHTRDRQHVRNTQIVQAPLALLEEEDELVARTIVVAHADGALVPDQRLPELEAGLFGLRLGDEHRFGIAEQVEMRVAPEHAVGFGEQLAEARVREDPEPVVARGLAVLEPRRRADGAVLLERFVGRIGDQQVDRFRRLVSQPAARRPGLRARMKAAAQVLDDRW